MEKTKRHIGTLVIFFAFWAVLALLAWLGIATWVFKAWFWTVIGALLTTQVYFVVCAALWPRRWHGARFLDVFSLLLPGLCASVTYGFGQWIVRHDEYDPMLLLGLLIAATVVSVIYVRVYAWPWLTWLLRLRKRPVLLWNDDIPTGTTAPKRAGD